MISVVCHVLCLCTIFEVSNHSSDVKSDLKFENQLERQQTFRYFQWSNKTQDNRSISYPIDGVSTNGIFTWWSLWYIVVRDVSNIPGLGSLF